jgi:hypothetical protein
MIIAQTPPPRDFFQQWLTKAGEVFQSIRSDPYTDDIVES